VAVISGYYTWRSAVQKNLPEKRQDAKSAKSLGLIGVSRGFGARGGPLGVLKGRGKNRLGAKARGPFFETPRKKTAIFLGAAWRPWCLGVFLKSLFGTRKYMAIKSFSPGVARL